MTNARTWPPPEAVVEALHRRYQEEVVEGLGLCPFARRAREAGRVERRIFAATDDGPTAQGCARALFELVGARPELEIVLLTFPVPDGHPWRDEQRFDGFLRAIRHAYEAIRDAPAWYMVAFHPEFRVSEDRPLTPDALVPLLRRTPDPVIQCVSAVVLDVVRREAQAVSHRRVREQARALAPELAAMLEKTVMADPTLSADIARANFERVGAGEGRRLLDDKIAELLRAREQAYAGADGVPTAPSAPATSRARPP
jgi:hypothetical protein